MKISKNFIIFLLLFYTNFGCDQRESDEIMTVSETDGMATQSMDGGNQANPMVTNPPVQSQIQIMLGIRGGAQVQKIAEEMSVVMADAVLFASQSVGGQITTFGTITQQGQNFVYQAMPNDRLVLQLTNTPMITLSISQLNGDLSSVERLLKNDHQINFRVTTDAFDLTIHSIQNGIERVGSLTGTLTQDLVTYQLQVQRQERVTSGVDFNAAQYESESQITGSITSNGQFNVMLNEFYRYKFIIYDNAVENVTFTSNNTWTYEENTYALSDAMIRYETFNGWPSPSDYWIAQGQLTQNGQVIGQISMVRKQLWVEIFLQMSNGEQVEIDRHILPQ